MWCCCCCCCCLFFSFRWFVRLFVCLLGYQRNPVNKDYRIKYWKTIPIFYLLGVKCIIIRRVCFKLKILIRLQWINEWGGYFLAHFICHFVSRLVRIVSWIRMDAIFKYRKWWYFDIIQVKRLESISRALPNRMGVFVSNYHLIMPFSDLLSSPKIIHKYHFKYKTIYKTSV